jgi:death on curing protein
METFFLLNGMEVSADIDEQEQVLLNLASGELSREEFVLWVQNNVRHKKI